MMEQTAFLTTLVTAHYHADTAQPGPIVSMINELIPEVMLAGMQA